MVIATLLVVVAIWLDLTPLVRGPDEWRWPVRLVALPAGRIIFPIAILVAYTFVCGRWLRAFASAHGPAPAAERGFLVFLILAAPLIQFVLAAAVWRNPLFEFFAATVSPAVTGYYSVAVTTPDLPSRLAHYTDFMPTLPIHPQTHPPGLVLIHWLGWRFFASLPALSEALAMPLRTLQCHNTALMTLDNPQIASATVGMLVPAIGALAVWPLYAFGKRSVGPGTAAMAAALFPILPMFAMWSSQWDQVYPLMILTGLYLAHTGLESRSIGRLFAAGVPLSIATFLSVGNAVPMAIVGLYGLVWLVKRRPERPFRMAAAFALGCASIWIVYAVHYRVSLQDLGAIGTRLAFESTRCPVCPSTTRSYGVWVFWNPIDVATFFSVPLTILLLTRLPLIVAAIRDLLRGNSDAQSGWARLAVAMLVTFVALDVSGIVRGEAGRLWSYFGPLLTFLALAPGKDAVRAGKTWEASLLIGLVFLQLIAMYTRWQVTPSFLDEPPEQQVSFAAPDPQVDRRASFSRQIELLGYDSVRSNFALDLTLYWQALTQPLHAYTVFVHVLDAEGNLIGQQDNMPLRDQLPTSCWQPGEIVADPYTIDLPPDARGPFAIHVGFYRLDTGQRLHLDDASGTSVALSVP